MELQRNYFLKNLELDKLDQSAFETRLRNSIDEVARQSRDSLSKKAIVTKTTVYCNGPDSDKTTTYLHLGFYNTVIAIVDGALSLTVVVEFHYDDKSNKTWRVFLERIRNFYNFHAEKRSLA